MLDMAGAWSVSDGDCGAVHGDGHADGLVRGPDTGVGQALPTERRQPLTKYADQLFSLLVQTAVARKKCPTNVELAEALELSNGDKFIRELKRLGFIRAEFFCGKLFRQVTILVGPHAGSQTASLAECPNFLAHWHKPHLHTVTRRDNRCKVPARDLRRHGKPRCAWCGKIRTGAYIDVRSCCSNECASAWKRHGYAATKAQVEQRRRRPAGPQGCATVEQWLAAGGAVYRENCLGEAVRA